MILGQADSFFNTIFDSSGVSAFDKSSSCGESGADHSVSISYGKSFESNAKKYSSFFRDGSSYDCDSINSLILKTDSLIETLNDLTEKFNISLGQTSRILNQLINCRPKVIDFQDSNFQQQVLDSKIPIFVEFWSPECEPCKAFEEILDRLSCEFKSVVKVGKIDIDKNPASKLEHDIQNLPTMMIFKDGEMVESIFEASADLDQLIELIEGHL